MKKIGISCLFYLISIGVGNAQLGFNQAVDVGFPQNHFNDLLVVDDTIIGYGLGFSDSIEWRQGLVLAKFDSSGEMLLSKIILHPPGDFYSIGKAWGRIINTSDGGYAMTASEFYGNDAVLIKTDHEFNVEFIKEYPDTINLSNFFYNIIETSEGYLLYGSIQRPDFFNDGFIRYIDKQGETIWFNYLEYSPYSTNVVDIDTIDEYRYIASIVTTSNSTGDEGFNSFLKFNLEGEELSYWRSADQPEIGFSRKIILADSVHLIHFGVFPTKINGNILRVQPTLSRMNSDFELEWVRHFGHVAGSNASVLLWDFKPTADGHFIGAGETLVKDGSDPTRRVGWLYKFSVDGDSIWERKIDAPFLPLYFTNSGYFSGVGVLSSGNIIAGGTTNEGNVDHCWLVKVSNDGCLDTLFCQTVSAMYPVVSDRIDIEIFPNPVHTTVTFKSSAPIKEVMTLSLTDLNGSVVTLRQFEQFPLQVQCADLPPGMYFFQITAPNSGLIWSGRMVKQ